MPYNTTDQERSQSHDAFEVIDKKPSIVSNCHDDPTFMYKDIEGYTCQYIKAHKPQKCVKEHNGIMIGINSCPESCNMIDECLKAIGVFSSVVKSNSNVTELENESNAGISLGENKTIDDNTIDDLSNENTDAGSVSGDLASMNDDKSESTEQKIDEQWEELEKEEEQELNKDNLAELEIEKELKNELEDNNNTSLNVVNTTESSEGKIDGQWEELETATEQELNNDNLAELEIVNETKNELEDNNNTSLNVANTTESGEGNVDGQWEELEKEAGQEFNNDNLAELEIENEIENEFETNNTSLNVVNTTETTEGKIDGQWEELEKEAEQEFNNDNLAELEIENEIENEWKNDNSTSWAGIKTGDVVESSTNDDGGYGNMNNNYGQDDEYDYGRESPNMGNGYDYDNEASWNNDNWNNDNVGTGAWDKSDVSSVSIIHHPACT